MIMDENTNPEVEPSLAASRSRRTKVDKKGRFAALERLKQAKQRGEKNKYEIKDEVNIYEEVDEDEYSKIVHERQEDDWIVDDDGSGYVEDGRDIFDEDIGAGDAPSTKGGKKSAKRKNANIRAPDSKPKNIRSMFAAAAVKSKPRKPEKDVKLNDEDLGDIMAELQSDASEPKINLAALNKPKKKASKSNYNPFTVAPKKPAPIVPLAPLNTGSSPINGANHVVDIKQEVEDLPSDMDTESIVTETIIKEEPKSPVKTKIVTALGGLGSAPSLKDLEEQERKEEAVKKEAMDMITDINFDDDFAEGNSSNKKSSSLPELTTTGWADTVKEEVVSVPAEVQVDNTKLPLVENDNGEQVLRMFWIDAYEDYYKQPGTVYLFGKVWIESAKAFVSCCIAVRNIERRVFFLPRCNRRDIKTKKDTDEPVSFLNLYQEFSDMVADEYKILKFKSKKAEKKYAFELEDVPAESEYLEVRYPAEYPALPANLEGETFSHVFGANTTSLEHLVIHRNMKGPCWLDVKLPQIASPPVSWCKVEAFVTTPENIIISSKQSATPPMVIMSLNLNTVTNPKTHQNEILSVSSLIHHEFHMDKPAPKQAFQHHFCAITKPNDGIFPFDFKEKIQNQKKMKVEVMGSERALLGFLLAKIHKVDPDIIVGHDIFGFDLDVLLHRVDQNKIPHWSRLGRLKRSIMPKFTGRGKGGAGANASSGRLVCDIKISAKELIRCRSYDLTELVSHVLKEKRIDVDPDQILGIYNSTPHLMQFIEATLMDSNFILRIMYDLMVLPLALQITNICGNIMSRTLLGGRSERNEYLLLHAFTQKNYIVPDKSYGKRKVQVTNEDGDIDGAVPEGQKPGRKKAAYAGGLVLEPKKGFYDKCILLLDFNSLYPSIIQEYNICFTTVVEKEEKQPEGEDIFYKLPEEGLEPGILPTEIRKLVESRRAVKKMMKTNMNHEAYMQCDIRQKALKLTANSMYGCLGFTFSRFYAKPLAAMITGKGREILMHTKDMVTNMNLEVIYGDTDSIMVNTNSTDLDEVFKLGNKVKSEVNKMYRLLEIDIDGVFQSMLLLKKKKYAALTVARVGDKVIRSQELKGLDIVRRDWCELAKQAGNFVVSQILSGDTKDTILENIHNKLMSVGEEVKAGALPIDLFLISKSLTKNPEEYPDKKSLPHVQVALRFNSRGGKKMRAGDTVYYVICEDGSSQPASQRAYLQDELAKNDNLKIDTEYYLSHQVHPVVSRLCDPIEGTDNARIAECLGLDSSSYRQAMQREEDAEENAMLGATISDEERYQDCDRFKFECPACKKQIIFDGVFTGIGSEMDCALNKCPNSECKEELRKHVTIMMNHLTIRIRNYVNKYYQGWLRCEDSACAERIRKMPLKFNRGHPMCRACHRGILRLEYTDSMLYDQICFYSHIFDFRKAADSITDAAEKNRVDSMDSQLIKCYNELKSHVDSSINLSAYGEVDLHKLFCGLYF